MAAIAMAGRIKPGLWVQMLLRAGAHQGVTVTVLHKGFEEAGLVLIKILNRDRDARVFAQARNIHNRLEWRSAFGDEWVEEEKADDYIQKERGFDPDLWVIEIEDPAESFELPDIL